MTKAKSKAKDQVSRINIYVKPIDFDLFDWARSQRQSLSEILALALYDYRKKIEKDSHS
jgi:hypothetical protein